MIIIIAHASTDENGKTAGPITGDNTGKEVCIRSFYKKPWNYVIRCTDSEMRERIAKAMELAANNDKIGYSQPRRNSLLNTVRNLQYNPGAAKVYCDCDCSSLVTVACIYAGIPEKDLYKNNNCCTTGNIRTRLMATGKFQTLTDSKYLNSDEFLYRGDILLREPGHVAVNITDGKSINTNTTITNLTSNKAIDISQYNIVDDYKTMVAQIKNVMIRVGYRSYEKGILTEDKLFTKHIKGCIDNNANIGIYFYDQSLNENEAIEEAQWVINKLKSYTVQLPIFIDSEYSSNKHTGRADGISKEQRTKNVIAFCNTIKSAGYQTGVYASDSWFKSMLEFDKLKNYIIWCARYSTQKPTISKYDIWQYGSEIYSWSNGGKPVDTNIIYNLTASNTTTVVNNTTQQTSNTSQISQGLTPEKPILLMGKVKINSGTLNVRSKPDTNSPVVMQLQKDTYIQLRGDLGTWYRMDLGYVSKQYVKEARGIVIGDNLRVRSTPDASKDNNIITTLAINTEVIICSAGSGWYYILLDNGTLGWVNGMYLRLKD